MRVLLASALAVLICTAAIAGGSENAHGPTSAARPSTFAAAASVVDAFHEALKSRKRDDAQALLDDQVQIYEQGHVERSKSEYASHHLDSDIEFTAATQTSQTARTGAMIGDLTYVSTESRISGSFEDKPIDMISLETMLLRRTSAGWRIVHIHWSSRTAKK
jgi:hypothetical protein